MLSIRVSLMLFIGFTSRAVVCSSLIRITEFDSNKPITLHRPHSPNWNGRIRMAGSSLT